MSALVARFGRPLLVFAFDGFELGEGSHLHIEVEIDVCGDRWKRNDRLLGAL